MCERVYVGVCVRERESVHECMVHKQNALVSEDSDRASSVLYLVGPRNRSQVAGLPCKQVPLPNELFS